MIKAINRSLLGLLGVCALGCAHHPAPTDQMASSQAAIRGAEEAGAMAVPQAALQVKLAEEELEQAHKLSANGDNQRAEDRALRASNDAELGRVIARQAETQHKLEQMASVAGSPSSGGDTTTTTTTPPSGTR